MEWCGCGSSGDPNLFTPSKMTAILVTVLLARICDGGGFLHWTGFSSISVVWENNMSGRSWHTNLGRKVLDPQTGPPGICGQFLAFVSITVSLLTPSLSHLDLSRKHQPHRCRLRSFPQTTDNSICPDQTCVLGNWYIDEI